MNELKRYRFICNLSFGDIYGQIIVWLIIIFASLAAALASMASNPLYAFATVGLILVVSLPFLLFAFVTTLFNHIEAVAVQPQEVGTVQVKSAPPATGNLEVGAA